MNARESEKPMSDEMKPPTETEETTDPWSAVDGTSQCPSLHWLEGYDHLVRCARREHGPDVKHRRNYDDGSWDAWTDEYGRVARGDDEPPALEAS